MGETHLLVGLQGCLTLDIVLQGLTGNLVVERGLGECREQLTMLLKHLP